MPKPTYSGATYAIARALAERANLSERDIATILKLKRSTVHHLLTHHPKGGLPGDFDPELVDTAARVFQQARIDGQRALAASLRLAADRIEQTISPTTGV